MSRSLARSLVFVTSASVLVIEILAVRLLAPYLGVSLEVFTGVIGVILAGISVGAWLGGRTADRIEPEAMLGPLLVGGGLTAVASPLIIDLVGPSMSTGPTSIVAAATLGFFPPAVLLSAVPPVVVKIQLASLAETGTVVGTYSAIGTAGAIFGTFVTGFVLIAAFPTRPIVLVTGSVLTLIGIALWASRSPVSTTSVILLLLGLVLALWVVDAPCQRETAYHCVVIIPDTTPPTGRTLLLDRLPNSYVDLADPTHLEFRYIRLMSDVIATETGEGPINMVSIGGGGFTLPGYVDATRSGSHNTVLEIDTSLVEIVRTELTLSDRIEVLVDDARISIREVPADSADVVIGDAYSGASVPWHLTTLEFTSEIERVLRGDGVYAMNVIDYDSLGFVRASTATIGEVFANVGVLAPPQYFTGRQGGNFVIVASPEPLDLTSLGERVASRGGTEIALTGGALVEWIGGAPVLRDDYAPVDQMLGRP